MKYTGTKFGSLLFVILLIYFTSLLSAEGVEDNRLSARDFLQKIEDFKENKNEFVLLDIRTKPEFDLGHIAGAEMLDFYSSEFINKLKELDRTKTYLIYCRSGNRTGQTLKIMQHLDFQHVYDLKDGIASWVRSDYPLDY